MVSKRRRSFDLRSFLAHVGAGQSRVRYAKNQNIFLQGDEADCVLYIHSGRVKVTVVSEHGKEAVIAFLGADAFLGEACLAGQTQRAATATAISDTEVVRLERTAVAEMIHWRPDFDELFISYLLNRAIRVEADLVDQLFNSTEKRLARQLLLLANFGKEGDPKPILAAVNQETLAEMIGTNRSRVNVFMNKFRQLGYIDYDDNHIEVRKALLNAVLLEQPAIKHKPAHSNGAVSLAE